MRLRGVDKVDDVVKDDVYDILTVWAIS